MYLSMNISVLGMFMSSAKRAKLLTHTQAAEHSGRACVYLSMNMSALGTFMSPRCTTLLPTQLPTLTWQRARICCIAFATRGAACSRNEQLFSGGKQTHACGNAAPPRRQRAAIARR
jgi:hypothetical protein